MINEQKAAPDDLKGLDVASAKEYILGLLSTLKLTEKELEGLKEEEAKWERRAVLAREQGKDDLLRAAEEERKKTSTRKAALENEVQDLKVQISNLKQQLTLLPTRERSIDPDLLEQELLILTGRMPGDEKEAAQDRAFRKLEKEAAADAALEALKARMGG